MNLPEIAKSRLVNQQLAGTKIRSAVNMVEYFAAIQGQEYAQTKWGLGLRLLDVHDDDIEKELNDGKILRTHLLRPTWHFVSAKDIRWLLKLTASRVHVANAYMYRQLELDTKIFNKCNKILAKILKDRNQLTRVEIGNAFKKQKIVAEGLRLIYIMMYAELSGVICSGARRGNQFTYALLDERADESIVFSKDEALGELSSRYFKSRGPATVKDFSTWSGLTLTECRRGVDMIKSNLYAEMIENEEYFFTSADLPSAKQIKKTWLLPVYDEYIMGYKDRSAISLFKKQHNPAAAFHYDSTIVFEGQVIGTWKRLMAKDQIDLKFDFFVPPGKGQTKTFEDAVNNLEKFTGRPVITTAKAETHL